MPFDVATALLCGTLDVSVFRILPIFVHTGKLCLRRASGTIGAMAARANVPPLTPHQARYILEKLIDERTVSAADVRRHLAGMWQEMSFLEKRIAELRGAAGSVQPVKRVKAAVKRVRRPRTVSPEVAASQKLQGQYLGYMRQVPEGDRKRFADIAKTKGREAAVAALKKRLGK